MHKEGRTSTGEDRMLSGQYDQWAEGHEDGPGLDEDEPKQGSENLDDE